MLRKRSVRSSTRRRWLAGLPLLSTVAAAPRIALDTTSTVTSPIPPRSSSFRRDHSLTASRTRDDPPIRHCRRSISCFFVGFLRPGTRLRSRDTSREAFPARACLRASAVVLQLCRVSATSSAIFCSFFPMRLRCRPSNRQSAAGRMAILMLFFGTPLTCTETGPAPISKRTLLRRTLHWGEPVWAMASRVVPF